MSRGDDPGPSAGPVRLVVIGPSSFDRACMVAGLAGADGLRVDACVDAAAHAGPPPDMVLLEDVDAPGSAWLSRSLDTVAASWPEAAVIVLTGRCDAGFDICRRAGVRACLPPRAGREQIVAAMRLVSGGLAVYPAHLLLAVEREERAGGAHRSSVRRGH